MEPKNSILRPALNCWINLETIMWNTNPRIGFFVCCFLDSFLWSITALQGNYISAIQQSETATGEGNGNPLQYSCLENPMDGGATCRLQSTGSLRVGHDWDFTFTFHLRALEKEMATHSSVLAWRIPGVGEPGGLPSLGSQRVRHDWSDLAAAAYIYALPLELPSTLPFQVSLAFCF